MLDNGWNLFKSPPFVLNLIILILSVKFSSLFIMIIFIVSQAVAKALLSYFSLLNFFFQKREWQPTSLFSRCQYEDIYIIVLNPFLVYLSVLNEWELKGDRIWRLNDNDSRVSCVASLSNLIFFLYLSLELLDECFKCKNRC